MPPAAMTGEKRHYFIFKGGELKYHGKKFNMGGKLLFEPPYKNVDPDIPLWKRLQKDTAEWFESLPAQKKFQAKDHIPALELSAAWTLFNSPYAATSDDPAVYAKLMEHCKIMFFIFFSDCIVDAQYIRVQEGLKNFRRLLVCAAEQSYHILALHYNTREELNAALEKSGVLQKYPVFEGFFACVWAVSTDFRDQWKFTSEELDEFARGLENMFKYMFWLNYENDLDYLYNEEIRPYLRIHKIAIFPMYEICKLMDGVQLEQKMRKEKHLKRLKFLGCALISQSNDILSSKKEIYAGELDNPILLDADERRNGGLITYPISLEHHIKIHDDYLEEYGQIYNFLREKFPGDSAMIKYADIVSDGMFGCVPYHVFRKDYYKIDDFSFPTL